MEQTPKLDWQRVRTIFEDALMRPPEERLNYAKHFCGGDEGIWAEVSSLLDSHESTESFLETPAVVQVVETIQTEENQLATGRRLLHYEIQKLIGSGGMGEVYLARDTRLGRNVAVKLLRQDLLPHFRADERLLREARASALLEHPNICQIHDILEVDGLSFIVMQHVVGTTLDEILSGRGVDANTALDIASQVAEGLAEAHRQGIIHRDIKPANIIVSDKGDVKILDFGLAKFIEAETSADAVSRLESTGGVMGTVPYMSPEQLLGEPVDARTDIFSFGAMLFEMLSGHSAFGRESNADTISAILREEPDLELIPLAFRSIVRRCLAKERAARYLSASELAEALTKAIERGPITKTTKSKPTGPTRFDAATGAVDLETRPLYEKDVSRPRSEHSRAKRRRFGFFGLLAVLVAGSTYGSYVLYREYAASQTGSTAVKGGRKQLIPFRRGDKFGFSDENKNLVIEAKYDDARPFFEGLAIVNIGRKGRIGEDGYDRGKYGAIDQNGNEVIQLKYDSIRDFGEGPAAAGVYVQPGDPKTEKFGVIDKSGREIVPLQYDHISKFNDGFAQIVLDKKVGYIDTNGSVKVPLVYGGSVKDSENGNTSMGLAAVKKERYGYVDMTAKEVIPFNFDEAGTFSKQDGLAAVSIKGKCGYIDYKGRFKIVAKFGECLEFREGIAAVQINNKWGFIDTNGNEVIPARYDAARGVYDGLAAVQTGGAWGYINTSGEQVIQPRYYSTVRFDRGLASVCIATGEPGTDGSSQYLKCGFIDKAGNEVIPLKYATASDNAYLDFAAGDFARVMLGDKDFYIDRNGVEYYEPDTSVTELPVPACGTVYDAVKEFSITTNNADRIWQYGYTDLDGTGFTLYSETRKGCGAILDEWFTHSDSAVTHLTVDQAAFCNVCSYFEPDFLNLHPNANGSTTVLRWKAPNAGEFLIEGEFRDHDSTTTDISIVKNESIKQPLFSDSIDDATCNAISVHKPFSMTVRVNAGETIDFRVAKGSGTNWYDSTGLSATITEDCSTPEL